MKNKIIGFALLLFATSCKKETSYSTTNYLCNHTSKAIEIVYYKDGIIQKNINVNTIIINGCYVVLQSNGLGKSDGPNYINNINYLDSAVVRFENVTSAVHYGFYVKQINNPDAILFGDERNIFDGRNWKFRVVSETKDFKETELKYVFVEADYVDAQNK